MTVELPEGLVAYPISPAGDLLGGPRITDYEFTLLDDTWEYEVGSLGSVEFGQGVEWDAYEAVKGGGSMYVTDLNQDLDWLHLRIQPKITLVSAGNPQEPRVVPVGVFLPSAPVEEWGPLGRRWKIELLDKLSILDQDIATGSADATTAYTAAAGSNVIELVKALITETGEETPAIQANDAQLPNDLVWEVGTTRLKVINDLLDTVNYFSLWCDGNGQYRADPWVPVQNRPPVYDMLNPFSSGSTSLMDANWTRDQDFYSIPNRYVLTSMGDGEEEGMVAVATNDDPDDPFSSVSRGRYITYVSTGAEATSQAALDSLAKRRLSDMRAVTQTLKISHVFLPDVRVNQNVMFRNADAGLNVLATVLHTSIPFDPMAMCQSTLRVAGIQPT